MEEVQKSIDPIGTPLRYRFTPWSLGCRRLEGVSTFFIYPMALPGVLGARGSPALPASAEQSSKYGLDCPRFCQLNS